VAEYDGAGHLAAEGVEMNTGFDEVCKVLATAA